MFKLSRSNIQPQQTDASRIVSSMLPQQYNATPIKTTVEALDLPQQVQADTIQTNGVKGYLSNVPPSLEDLYRNMDVKRQEPTTERAYIPSLASVYKNLTFTPDEVNNIDWDKLDNALIWTDDRNKVRSDHPLLDLFIQKESRGNATVNKNGVLQILDSAWSQYGEGRDKSLKLNPWESSKVAVRYLKDIKKALDKNGIPATALNAWILYNQGIGGGKLIFKNMDKAIKDVNPTIYSNMLGNMSDKNKAYYTQHPDELTGRAFINLHAPDFTIK